MRACVQVVVAGEIGRGGGGTVYLGARRNWRARCFSRTTRARMHDWAPGTACSLADAGMWRELPVAVKTIVFEAWEGDAAAAAAAAAGAAAGGGGQAPNAHFRSARAIMETAISASVGHRHVVRLRCALTIRRSSQRSQRSPDCRSPPLSMLRTLPRGAQTYGLRTAAKRCGVARAACCSGGHVHLRRQAHGGAGRARKPQGVQQPRRRPRMVSQCFGPHVQDRHQVGSGKALARTCVAAGLVCSVQCRAGSPPLPRTALFARICVQRQRPATC